MSEISADHPAVAIYRDVLLAPSETFIVAQAGALRRHRPVYLGLRRRTDGLALNAPAIVLEETARSPHLSALLFRTTGIAAPSWRKAVAAGRPALVHAHFGTSGVVVCPLAAALGLPLAVTFHGFDIAVHDDASLAFRFYARARKRLFRDARRVIAVSRSIRDLLVRKGCDERKIAVHYIGVDVQRFPCAPRDGREPVVLFVGRLVEKKGCSDLLDAMGRCRDLRLRTVVIGSGPEEAVLRRRAAELGIDCAFLGTQSSESIGDWMRRALLFCVPSVTASNGDAEGLPIVFIEAQSSGLPVVSTMHGGIPEAVAHGETGLLVPERDPAALAVAIRTLATDRALWDRCSVAGRSRVERQFDLRRQTSALEALYDEVRAAR